MQVQKSQVTPTSIKLTIAGDQLLLDDVKAEVLRRLSKTVKMQGFRAGKAPLSLVEKQLNPSTLQSEFLDAALNRMYINALGEHKVRPVAQPAVNITKFVPFTTLEFDAVVEAIGDITLPDYKKITVERKKVTVTDKDVDVVIDNLRNRVAEKREMTRAAKKGDEVILDFFGSDARTGEAVSGAASKDYPLTLGSNSFIPGFEDQIVGLKAGDEKDFELDFPKDYSVKTLQGSKVHFKVSVKNVQELVLPAVDNAFVATVGPFKTVQELKADIKKQIVIEREAEADREYESDLLSMITEKAEIAVPKPLVDEEIERLEREERQNVVYRGQTWEEHLAAEGITDEEHKEKNRAGAELRVKAGLVLAEISEAEKIDVTKEELDLRMELLKGQYTDPKMQAELNKPEARREIASRIMSEKTIAALVGYNPLKKTTQKAV